MIGERIKRLRLQKGISLTELAEKAGVAKSYISSIERNLQKNPSIQFLEKIAAVLQIPVDTLLHDEITLAELQKLDPDVVAKDVFAPEWGENGGLAPNSEDYLWVEFEFEDKGDQNIFQGDSLNLEWTFNASQGEGETK